MAKKQPEYTFEIYCLNDTLTADNWKSLYKAFITHLGILGGKFRVIFAAKDNIIRFFMNDDNRHFFSVYRNLIVLHILIAGYSSTNY